MHINATCNEIEAWNGQTKFNLLMGKSTPFVFPFVLKYIRLSTNFFLNFSRNGGYFFAKMSQIGGRGCNKFIWISKICQNWGLPYPLLFRTWEYPLKTAENKSRFMIFSEWYVKGTLGLKSLLFLYRYDKNRFSVSFALFTKYKLVKFLGVNPSSTKT